ncbi:cell division control protein 2C [Dorcoceras hygrometricum]|nr:cell division control protein 2C [Dorcoceras hygrometricum]
MVSVLLSVTSIEKEKSVNRYLLYTIDAYLLTDSVPSPRNIKSDSFRQSSQSKSIEMASTFIANSYQIIAETSKMGSDEKEQEEQRVDETDIGDDFDQWLEESFKDFVVNETGTVVEAKSIKVPVVEKDMDKAVGSKNTEEEHMSIDDLLLQISDDMMLPISTHDKGKEPLEENEPVRGNPAKETVELICGDVDFLVQLRDKVMTDVVDFFHSLSLNKLSDFDGLRYLKEKEKLMLSWEETEFLETAVKRRMYILAKYREMLLRKFLDSHRRYFAPGQPWTAMASQIIVLLSVAHSKSLEDILAQQKEHGIITDRPSSSQLFKDLADNSGAVLAKFYSMAKSTCWVRPMILVNRVWTPIQGNDFWRSSCRLSLFVNRRQVPESVVDTEFVPHGLFIEPVQYLGAAPSLIKTWGWARVCTEIFRYSMFGCFRPVRKDVCRDIVVYSLEVERIPASFRRIFQQGVYTDSFVGYFSDSDVQSIPEFDSNSSDGSTVYRSPSPQVESFEEAESVEPIAHLTLGLAISGVAQEEQSYFVESPESSPPTFQHQETSISSSESPMHFNSDDIPLDDIADVQPTFPAFTVDISPLLDDLKISLSQRMDNAQKCSTRWKNQDDIQTLRFNAFKKVVLAQGVAAGADSVEVRKEIKALDAKINSLDGQVAAIRSEQLEFQTKIAADILSLSTQLGDLVDYIRGGDAKKGEGSSSLRPLPPPVNQDIITVKFNRNYTIRSTAKLAVNRDVHIRVTRDRDVIIRYRYSKRNSYRYSVFNGRIAVQCLYNRYDDVSLSENAIGQILFYRDIYLFEQRWTIHSSSSKIYLSTAKDFRRKGYVDSNSIDYSFWKRSMAITESYKCLKLRRQDWYYFWANNTHLQRSLQRDCTYMEIIVLPLTISDLPCTGAGLTAYDFQKIQKGFFYRNRLIDR